MGQRGRGESLSSEKGPHLARRGRREGGIMKEKPKVRKIALRESAQPSS